MAADDRADTKNEVIAEARNEGRKVHFASLMDLGHLKNSELEPQFQKQKGRVVLQGDTVKDDSGSYAVFIEKGSSASQMTAAKVMDIISRLPGCGGQAADAESACTQVKMEDAPSLVKFRSQNVQIFGHVYQNTNGSNHGPVWKIQSFLLNVICTVILWQDYYGKGSSRKFYQNTVGKKFQIGNAHSSTEKKDDSCLCVCDDIKLAGKKNNIDPMWKILVKDVDFGRTDIIC